MIAPRLGNAPISSASTGAWAASTIARTEPACSARKSARPVLIGGSTSAPYFAVSASASGAGRAPTCRTVAPIANSLLLFGSVPSSLRRRTVPPLVSSTTLERHHWADERPGTSGAFECRRHGSDALCAGCSEVGNAWVAVDGHEEVQFGK